MTIRLNDYFDYMQKGLGSNYGRPRVMMLVDIWLKQAIKLKCLSYNL